MLGMLLCVLPYSLNKMAHEKNPWLIPWCSYISMCACWICDADWVFCFCAQGTISKSKQWLPILYLTNLESLMFWSFVNFSSAQFGTRKTEHSCYAKRHIEICCQLGPVWGKLSSTPATTFFKNDPWDVVVHGTIYFSSIILHSCCSVALPHIISTMSLHNQGCLRSINWSSLSL